MVGSPSRPVPSGPSTSVSSPDDTDRAPQYSLIQWTAAPSGES